MKRVWIFVSAGLLLLLLFAWWYSKHEWLTDELLAQIKLGMKKEEVESLLGKPQTGYLVWLDCPGMVTDAPGPQITLTALNDAWLPTLNSIGFYIRHELGRQLWGSSDKSWIWVGHERALVLLINDSQGVNEILAFAVRKTGGGFLSWLSRKWDDWM